MPGSMKKAYEWAIDTCNDPNVRYSQDYRAAQKVGSYTYYDCSSFIYYALKAGGWTNSELGGSEPFYTGNERSILLNNAGFEDVTSTGVIKAGDIGINRSNGSGHTEMCYKGGTGKAIFMGAHGRVNISGKNQVSIGSSSGNTEYKRTFTWILRCKTSDMDDASPIIHADTDINMYVVAAIAGNFWGESNINPGVWESLVPMAWDYIYSQSNPNRGGYGLGQWTNTSKSSMRLYDMYCYLRESGYETYSGNGQCAYVIEENVWQNISGYSIKSLSDFLDSDSTDLSMLVETWQHCWEGLSSASATEQRIGYATQCYNYIKEHKDDSVKWIESNNYLGESDILNNAVALYQWFNAWHKNNANPDLDEERQGDTGYTLDSENNPETIKLTLLDILEAMAGKSKNSGNGQNIHIIRKRK